MNNRGVVPMWFPGKEIVLIIVLTILSMYLSKFVGATLGWVIFFGGFVLAHYLKWV